MSKLSTKKIPIALTETVQPSVNDRFKIVGRKNCWTVVTFTHSFRPIYYFARIFGSMPYTIYCDSNGNAHEPKVRIVDGVWFVISMCIFLSMAFFSYRNMESLQNPNTSSYILILGDQILLILCLIFGAQIIGMDMLNRDKLVDILKKITAFDKEASLNVVWKLLFAYSIVDHISPSFRWFILEFISIMRKDIDVAGFIVRQF